MGSPAATLLYARRAAGSHALLRDAIGAILSRSFLLFPLSLCLSLLSVGGLGGHDVCYLGRFRQAVSGIQLAGLGFCQLVSKDSLFLFHLDVTAVYRRESFGRDGTEEVENGDFDIRREETKHDDGALTDRWKTSCAEGGRNEVAGRIGRHQSVGGGCWLFFAWAFTGGLTGCVACAMSPTDGDDDRALCFASFLLFSLMLSFGPCFWLSFCISAFCLSGLV